MFIRVVLLACFLMSINLAAAGIDMARVDCVAAALGFEGDVLAEVDVSNIKCLNIHYITQNSGKLMKSVKVFWYNNFYYIFI